MTIIVHILGSIKLTHPNGLYQNIVSSSLSCIWSQSLVATIAHYMISSILTPKYQKDHTVFVLLCLPSFIYCGVFRFLTVVVYTHPSKSLAMMDMTSRLYLLYLGYYEEGNSEPESADIQTSFEHNDFNVFGKYINTLVEILNDPNIQVLDCRVKVI